MYSKEYPVNLSSIYPFILCKSIKAHYHCTRMRLPAFLINAHLLIGFDLPRTRLN